MIKLRKQLPDGCSGGKLRTKLPGAGGSQGIDDVVAHRLQLFRPFRTLHHKLAPILSQLLSLGNADLPAIGPLIHPSKPLVIILMAHPFYLC
jgi:hypothetical protein